MFLIRAFVELQACRTPRVVVGRAELPRVFEALLVAVLTSVEFGFAFDGTAGLFGIHNIKLFIY
jgi:hypothetical protein